MPEFNRRGLMQQALQARRKAYAPYSLYPVGSALLAANGDVISSASVENACIAADICAPHGAFLKAVSESYREFVALAIATLNGDPPCGICRQVIAEFAPDIVVLLVNEAGEFEELSMAAVMATPFGPHPA